MNAVAQAEIAGYVEAVRAALADLSPQVRDELLEDLPDHLAEVAAEGQGSLEERLGPPVAYAAELRASAGLEAAGGAQGEETVAQRLQALADDARRGVRRIDLKIGPMLGYATAGDFLRLLRPAWWVLRGYVAAMVVTLFLDSSGPVGLLPRLGGSEIVGFALLVGCVVGSIWLARRPAPRPGWPRVAMQAATVGLALLFVVGLLDADRRTRSEGYYSPVYGNPYEHINDVYVYDEHGRLLTNVRLFDQDGQPIQLGSVYCDWQPDTPTAGVAPYPRCPDQAPFVFQPTPALTPTTEPTAAPTSTPTPEAASPGAGAQPPPAPESTAPPPPTDRPTPTG